MSLTNKLRTGALIATLGLSGCATIDGKTEYMNTKEGLSLFVRLFEAIPVLSIPAAIISEDLKKGGKRDRELENLREERERLGQSGVAVITPEDYIIKMKNYDEIMYDGKTHGIVEINPPNITLNPKVGENYPYYHFENRFTIPIEDMFKK